MAFYKKKYSKAAEEAREEEINIEDILRHFSKEVVKEKKVLAKYQKNFDSATDARCEDEWAEKIVGQENLINTQNDLIISFRVIQ